MRRRKSPIRQRNRIPYTRRAVVLLADDFEQQVANGLNAALELETMLLTHNPEEIFAAEDSSDWNDWVEFFSRTKEADDRRKGLVEVEL